MDTNFFERLEALNAKKAELQKEYDAIRSDAKEMAVKLVKQFGFAAAEIGCGEVAPAKPARVKRPPKYQNPAGDETWTGQGKKPKWFEAALVAGITEEDMLIKPAA